ncbi:EamA family transporter [Pseudomonas gingeri]|uniref:DMT family transporter n=1 Tax=Pseudomonas gingeri TaxID=117681 RepID=UPI0015A0A644|nr:EamA family transporter [Pseudomonas gingeri]NVZ65305.1 EamA family transporter [Pseudomonas gingeri]NVZ74100.1 EamA family transporter [Pseudomonas gingeri]NWE48338.1 EamA family transporter [Pseudomonas gingeri]
MSTVTCGVRTQGYWLAAVGAILVWSTLALSVTFCADVPPLFMTGIALSIGALMGLPWVKAWSMPWPLLLIGTVCMLGYHVIYFYALQMADPIGVSLIHYLWPVMIVVLAPLFVRNGTLSKRCLLAGIVGFLGAIISCDTSQLVGADGLLGYGLALLSALVWAIYSLLAKKYPGVQSASVGLFCLISGVVCLVGFRMGHPWPSLDTRETLALVYMGIGPMGGAFYLWDLAMKKADPQQVAVLSYATPVLSTAFLALYLGQGMQLSIWFGALLVVVSMVMTRSFKL